MRKRDLGILLLAAFAVLVCLQKEGQFSFQEAWSHDSQPGGHMALEGEPLPPPVVADLNGDGRSEVVMVTHDAKLMVLEPGRKSKAGLFKQTIVRAETSLLPSRVRVATGRAPVALAAGSLDAPKTNPREGARKQVIVVVTAGWSILCYDHNLKLLWENSVQEDFPHGAHHREVAIHIGNHTLRSGDRGSVIVGGSMEVAPQLVDPLAAELEAEDAAQRLRKSADKKEGLEDVSGGSAGSKERHFSYYAYSGGDGALRWKHDSHDFRRDASALSEQLLPQHNYKLDASALNARHFGEAECREFREAVLDVMPHRWDRRSDTHFELAHFEKHRRRTHRPGDKGRRTLHPTEKPAHAHGQDHSNPVTRALGKAAELATKPRQAKANSSHSHVSNAVVAHLKEGIEAIHLYSGRTICKLLLPPHQLHADVNGDGVLDHVQASGGHGQEALVVPGSTEPMKPCWGVATSGVPVREQLFNGSICRPASMFSETNFASRHFGRSAQEESASLEVATPILMPIPDGHHHRRNSRGEAIFLNSRGQVTAFKSESLHHRHGQRRWQVATSASWSNPFTPAGVQADRAVPTLIALPLRAGGPPELILAAGDKEAVLISPTGSKLVEFELPAKPIEPLLVADFNNDGLNDLIVTSFEGYYGFAQVRQPGAVMFSTLVGCLIVAIAVEFLLQHFNQPKGGRGAAPKRATD